MANTRPFAHKRHCDDTCTTDCGACKGVRGLDPRKVDVLQQIAASTAVEAETWSIGDSSFDQTAGFAVGVASVLAWLNGEPPSAELAELLELEDDA